MLPIFVMKGKNMDKKRILFVSMPLPVTNDYTSNSGNTVYMIAGESYFYGINGVKVISHIELKDILKTDADFCKRNFDIAIGMEANVLGPGHYLSENPKFIKSLKIPFFCLGIGAQADINYSLDFLKEYGDNIKLYIDTILQSGGDIALRGNFTNECLKELGYNNLFVSGCPSLFIKRQNLKISNNKVEQKDFKPMFNAHLVQDLNYKLYKENNNCVFFDQDQYLELLYNPDVKNIQPKFENKVFIELFKSGKIKGDMNYIPWQKQIIQGKFNFSYGSRMHGNIIAIQNGIPAFVKAIDSRTREISEFFGIPNSIEYNFNEKNDSLYDLYKSISYEKFNELYPIKLNAFIEFLDKHKIPHRLNDNNDEFFDYIKNLGYETYTLDYYKQKKYINLAKSIRKKTILKSIFSITNSFNKKHKVITIFGIKIKFKKI